MEAKKISFGFSKISKKPNLLPSKENVKEEPKVELIKCLEGQEIKLVEEKPEEKPLVIPLKDSHKTSAALASLMKRRAVLLGEEEPEEDTNPTNERIPLSNGDAEEDIEKRAARELLADIQKNSNGTDTSNNLVLPVVKPEDLPLDGAKESSLDDYESIPIQDFGKAMLRGMGWTEPPAKKNKNGIIDDMPIVRPKGMGLGADKALKKAPLLVAPEANEVLEIKRNAYVRILGGKHKDLYGQIEGFDDHAGRVIVKMAIGGAKEAFNEFLCQPVSKKEFSQYGKCINTTKYEEYKRKENEHGQIILSKEEKDQLNVKDEKKIEKEIDLKNEEDSKYSKNNRNFESKSKYEDYQDKESDRRRDNESDRRRDKENDRRRDKYDDRDRKMYTKEDKVKDKREYNRENYKGDRRDDDDRDFRRDSNRDEVRRREYKRDEDERDHRRDYKRDEDDRDYRRDYKGDDKKDKRDETTNHRRDYDRHDTKSYKKYDNEDDKYHKDSRNESSRKDYDRNYFKTNKDCERSSTRDTDRQRERDRDQKPIKIKDSSDSGSDDHSSKHKKSKKSKKKSKKSKKSKSKYQSDTSSSSSDSETSSSDSDSYEKHKKHKKKSKKSKKQRERSRSKGRR